ncbi:MAG: MBL fold metallo-hydrolase [Nitrospiraceae bacterium]|nr:MBL fold metallo-hydrolase [Nitrospiraceae bacterium]
MKIIIHRGSNEIGGTCIQLSTDKTTIMLDLGMPLSKESKTLDLASIKTDAIIISHPHQDHYGLIDAADSKIPVYIGRLGKSLIDVVRLLLDKPPLQNEFRNFEKWQPFTVGDFRITPYLVDHSAVDAYAFLIEAEGKKVFYSGDFRAHGRKHILFDTMLEKPVKGVDVLFMEGTMMQRSNADFPAEAAVEEKIYETIKEQENISFLISSSQNVDRLVSAFRACKRAGKIFVIDLYTAWVLELMRTVTGNVPGIGWKNLRVYADRNYDEVLKANPEVFGNFRRSAYQYRIQKEELQADPAQYLYLSKMSKFRIIDLYKGGKAVNLIYSQWLGYLKCSNDECYGAEEIAAYQSDKQINFVYAHSSGHATVQDLKRFAATINPKMLIPIHTECGAMFKDCFDNVYELSDQHVVTL